MKLKPIVGENGSRYPLALPQRRHRGLRLRRLGAVAALCLATGCSASTSDRGAEQTSHSSTRDVTHSSQPQLPRPIRRPTINDDRDSDDIADADDLCPQEAEDLDNFEDDDGCPDPDNDQDRFEDAVDACPDHPENYNGIDDEDGCPDRSAGIIISPTNLQILDQVFFPDGATDVPLKARPILDAVAATLKGNPQILMLEIQAHSDERGSDVANIRTSRTRAEAVKQYLVDNGGIEPGRLRANGFGERCPIDARHNEEGWQRNRRVEFKILRTTDGDAEDALPCEAARDLSPRGP